MIRILDVIPPAAVPGGEIYIRWSGEQQRSFVRPNVLFRHSRAHLISASAELIVVQVPEEASSGDLWISVNGKESNKISCEVATLLTANLHPVANPALDPEGSLYSTLSGRKGEKVAHSIFKIEPSGSVQPFVSDLMNPTGIVFNSLGEMFVSSRHDGSIYKISTFGEKSIYAKGMGVATGIAFDHDDNLYVGDRTGKIGRAHV